MHRPSSSRKELRAERISQSPYKRSERKQVTKQPSWLSNIANSISSSISRFRAGGRDADDMSVSGSDDDWTGEPPEHMRGQDMFSLAAAAGRAGSEFEQRAETWRANKGLLTSGRRKSPSKANWDLLNLSPERAIRPSPSMPALQPAQRTPLPPSSNTRQLFQTPQVTSEAASARLIATSASARALSAFVSSKGDDVYSPQDVEAMESLIRSMRSDAAGQKTGGWSGALTTPMRSTPGAAATPATPGSLFSVGSTPASAVNRSSHRVKYLGPGMSPRRLKTTTRSMSSLFDEGNDQPGKRRKTGLPDVEVEELDNGPPAASSSRSPLTTSASVPNLAAASKAADFNRQARLSVAQGSVRRPSPLAQSSVTASPDSPATPRDIGKKRARDIIQDIIDEDIMPHEEQPKLVINPYEETALPSGKHFSPYASLRHSASTNSLSGRRSLASSRGAAAKLEESRLRDSTSGRKLSTLEMINRGKPSSAAATPQKPKHKALPPKPKAPEPDVIAIDEDEPAPLKKTQPTPAAAASTPSRRTPAPVTFPDTEPASAFPAPSLSKSTLGASRSTSPSKAAAIPAPSTADAVVAATKPQPMPVFTPSPIGLGPAPAAAPAPADKSKSTRAPTKKLDSSVIYLSAKDSALSEDKAALPFFTFTLPAPTSQPSDAVKAAALKDAAPSFDFEVPMPPLHISAIAPAKTSDATPAAPAPTPAAFSFFKPAAPAGAWTCDTCMLQNPATATTKCSICEAPKPGAAPAPAKAPIVPPSVPSGGFSFKPAPAADGEWTCDTCMLKNPASATEKCTVCEAAKPGAKAAAAKPAVAATMPSAPTGGFSFGGGAASKPPPKAEGEWTCDTCMLKNPASATDKCTVCEAAKPGAKPAVAKPSAPAAMPSVPTGGFNFGGASAFGAGASASASSAAPAGMPAPPSGGFSFGGKAVTSSSSDAAAPAPAAGGFSFKPPAGGFSFGGATNGPTPPSGGFSFGAKPADTPSMLAKPSGGADEWTCGTCMLKNPASATTKCTVCEAPKP